MNDPAKSPSLRPLRWNLLLLVWPAITLILATHTHIYQAALHLTFQDIPTSWTDSFRFPVVECFFGRC